jgi:hypothetical protein
MSHPQSKCRAEHLRTDGGVAEHAVRPAVQPLEELLHVVPPAQDKEWLSSLEAPSSGPRLTNQL